MIETTNEKIDRFRKKNKRLIEIALSESNIAYEGIPGKLILCAIFDSLSKAAFPKITSNGMRFKDTISHHAKWPDGNRVSLLQLCYAFETLSEIPADFLNLSEWAKSQRTKYFTPLNNISGDFLPLTLDPLNTQLEERWPCKNGMPVKLAATYLPEMFTHSHLLWKYRNKLAHEFRLLGAGFESSSLSEDFPSYQNISSIQHNEATGYVTTSRWELIYPIYFFAQLTECALESICSEYRTRNTSPFAQYVEGSFWLEK